MDTDPTAANGNQTKEFLHSAFLFGLRESVPCYFGAVILDAVVAQVYLCISHWNREVSITI